MKRGHVYFHLHLVSDSTGETLLTAGRAAVARYESIAPIEHVYPLVRSTRHLERVIGDIEAAPGIVLYTLVDREIADPTRDRPAVRRAFPASMCSTRSSTCCAPT